MQPEEILNRVCTALDRLIETGDRYHGLFPSFLDLNTNQMLTTLPPHIPGQRDGDRSWLGSNLIHDEATLKTLYALSIALGRPAYAQAADRYLERFATHCTDTVTGLFPWGEHAYWHLAEDRVGNSTLLVHPERTNALVIHDHLRQAPRWLWDKLDSYNPACVQRFGEGLDYHYKAGQPAEYTRHASIMGKTRLTRDPRSCDFPRHGGFYIFDWACAWQKSGRADLIAQIRKMLDYWWHMREPNGLLLIESRTPPEEYPFKRTSPAQTLSLATSLLETAPLLEAQEPALAAEMRRRARAYIDGFFAAPHDLARGILVDLARRDTNEVDKASPVWGSVYGIWPASYIAVFSLCAYRLEQDERLLQLASTICDWYLQTPMPGDIAFPAMDAGLALGLAAELYDLTAEPKWLMGGLTLAEPLIGVYLDHDLPRSAAGINWYESQMGPGFLLHGLARLALLAQDREHCPLNADYTAR